MKTILFLGLLLSVCTLATAQKVVPRKMPTGEEIAKAAKFATLNSAAFSTTENDGIKVIVMPVDLSKVKNIKDLENGQVIAVVAFEGNPHLPDGKYNVYVVKLNDGWHEFFESGGKLFGPAKRVEITMTKPNERRGVIGTVMVPGSCWCVSICPNGNVGVCIMCQRCE